MTAVRRLFVFLCGYEIIPQTVSLRTGNPRFFLAVPITCYLLDTQEGWVMFDTGLDEANLKNSVALKALFADRGWNPPPLVRPEHELAPQLAALGLGFGDISTVVLSHLHADHSGHIKRMPQAQLFIQQSEYDYAFSDRAGPAWFASDYDDPALHWRPVEGDHELMDGLTLLSTPGHAPGHQSLLVDLPRTGRVLLAGDVGDLRKNFREEILPGEAADDAAALASIRRVNGLVARGAKLFLTHDPDLLETLRLAPEAYD